MPRDVLYLLKAEFTDGPGQPYYCPDCAQITGVLSYFPQLRYSLDIRHVDFARPRNEIVALIGTENQGCPVLILADAPFPQASEFVSGVHNGKSFVSGAKSIANYWSATHGISRPH
ncbi:MAG: DUF3088 domain-containing protein [Planctomycetaceae bacterium]|nr:DUF3088 domain-containing protein [Planctomycetaceae bacterium]